jgi:hypothetical protein
VTRAVGRALATAVLGALLGGAWLVFFYAVDPRLHVSFDTDPPRLLTGVYPVEFDRQTGLTFAWTGAEMALQLPGLDRTVDWVFEIRVRGARAGARQNPLLSFSVDGTRLTTWASTTDFERVTVTIPARPERRRGVVLSMRASETFVPGPNDPRPLGVMVDELWLTPSGVPLPPRSALAGASLAAAALGASVALLGVTPGSAVGAAILLSAGDASLVARGFGPFTDYPLRGAHLAAWIGTLLVVVTAGVQLTRRQALRNTARFVAAFSAGAVFLKLLVLFHPEMPIGDALFHAHRFQWVLGGKLYFTSTAPGNYLFPYAPGLYVFAAPVAALVPRGDADMALLRVVVLGIDAAAALFLYTIIVRAGGDRIAGAIAVAVYHVLPLDFGIVATGNLTNAFAQSLSVFVLAIVAAGWVRWERPWSVGLLTAVVSAAFLSHTSTFAILFATCVLVAAAFVWKGGPALRSPARAVLVAAGMAIVVSFAVYYAHFLETYRSEFARISKETAVGAADAGGRGIVMRAASVPRYLHSYLGTPALVLAAVGGSSWHRRGARDPLTLAVSAWVISSVLFLALGVLTPVDMRYYLAVIPAIAILAAHGASTLWSGRGPARVIAVASLIWVVWAGVATWWDAL